VLKRLSKTAKIDKPEKINPGFPSLPQVRASSIQVDHFALFVNWTADFDGATGTASKGVQRIEKTTIAAASPACHQFVKRPAEVST